MLPEHLQQQIFFMLRGATSTVDVKHALDVADQALERAGTTPVKTRGFWQSLLPSSIPRPSYNVRR